MGGGGVWEYSSYCGVIEIGIGPVINSKGASDRFIGTLIDLLIGLVVGVSIGQLIGLLIDLVIGPLICLSIGFLVYSPSGGYT